MSAADTPTLPASFWESVLALPSTSDRLRWYMCVLVTLSSLNYSDVVPQVYNHLDEHLLSTMSPEDRFAAAQRLREGLIKSTGIVGAARTGNAMRALAACIPVELREKESPRSKESDETARKRGKEFWTRIYSRNRAFDPEASVRASPDYAFIIREVLYGRIFSFDGVIDDLTTGYVIVSALYGMDCPNQLQHHMKGMLINGATREELKTLQDLCLGVANILGVKSRHGPAPIPEMPE
ncbi:hypothetical protein N7510_009746 [Penicillium lagena]|uniref:uncharacterized protein n=1 Tax=Penicillium lagena TaxID=94218 RepID=UPI0025414C1E|nr:uncharacterized protein N7510_009746 [Penicillium lagena]KAJ5604592.1 hypothetical protein N7510_009746 [Penicillium lagena]